MALVVLSLIMTSKKHLDERENYSHNTELKEVTVNELSSSSLAVNEKGEIIYDGEPLFVGEGNESIPATLDDLMKKGITQQLVTKKETLLSKLKSSMPEFLQPVTLSASDSAPHIEYLGQVRYGQSIVGEFRINGVPAFCIQHEKASPGTGTPYGPVTPYDDTKIQRALFYGWGGPENIFTNKTQGWVVTSLILSRLYNGTTSGQNLNGYAELWDKVQNGRVPDTNVKLSDSHLAISVKNGRQVSETTTFQSDRTNSITITVPSQVTIVNETTGARRTNGSMKIMGGQKFHLEAPLNYGTTYNSGVLRGSLKEYQPIVTMPKSSHYQVLGAARWYTDPDNTVSFTVPFKRQEAEIKVEHRDIYNNNRLVSPADSYKRLIGSSYEFSPRSRITTNNGNNVYLPNSTRKATGTVPANGRTITFYYDLTRDITVNHIDARDNRLITSSKDTKRRGESYSYSHRTNLKKGNYTYRPLSTKSQSGTVGGSNITLDFYYDIPLIKTGVDKIQVYTAPADEGLPVIVDLIKENNYPYSIEDMNSSTISVNLYKGEKKIEGRTYTARNLPTQIEFKVPASELEKNELDLYTVKLEDFNKNDFDIPSNRLQIATDGYTSAETTLEVHANETDKVEYEGVIKTERTVGEDMIVFNEFFTIPIEKIKKMKTGYGFYMPIDLSYHNDLGNLVIDPAFHMVVPESIVDKSFIPYDTINGESSVPLEITKNNVTWDHTKIDQRFELQHVNVERKTGHLFSDEQVNNNDSRIKNELVSGDRKFYLPIWGHIGEYDLYIATTNAIGINLIDIKINHTLDVVAHMYLHMDSPTKDKDAIHFEPINQDDPFPHGVPDNWTPEEVEQLKEWINGN